MRLDEAHAIGDYQLLDHATRWLRHIIASVRVLPWDVSHDGQRLMVIHRHRGDTMLIDPALSVISTGMTLIQVIAARFGGIS